MTDDELKKIDIELSKEDMSPEAWEMIKTALRALEKVIHPRVLAYFQESKALEQYLNKELQKPQYGGQGIGELFNSANFNDEGEPEPGSLFLQAIKAARAAERRTVAAQQAGRDKRRAAREAAEKAGAVMEIYNDALPIFSRSDMLNAFTSQRISKLGKLAPEAVDDRTGMITKDILDAEDVVKLDSGDIPFKAMLLLNAIQASTVENFRDEFVAGGTIRFYVKGVLDRIDIDPRIRDDNQLTLERKTAGVLYLEKQFEQLVSLVGTTPDGSRYSVLNYYGYDVNTDTMSIRTPYLYELWLTTQRAYKERNDNKQARHDIDRKPLKKDLIPLEVNLLFKGAAAKEDDAVLEIAAYITNTLLRAGTSTKTKTTKIKYRTIINNCPRLAERLEKIESLPNTEILPDGKKRNNLARYNTELRKIARACELIMDKRKCIAQEKLIFESFEPGTKNENGQWRFIAPTKRTLSNMIIIKWRKRPDEA